MSKETNGQVPIRDTTPMPEEERKGESSIPQTHTLYQAPIAAVTDKV